MNQWWWQVITEFYQRVAVATFHAADEPPPAYYAHGMLALIARLTADPACATLKPGLSRRALTLQPPGAGRKLLVRWVATDLYEIEMEGGGELLDLPWDGRIVVPSDVVLEALANCARQLTDQGPPRDNGFSHTAFSG